MVKILTYNEFVNEKAIQPNVDNWINKFIEFKDYIKSNKIDISNDKKCKDKLNSFFKKNKINIFISVDKTIDLNNVIKDISKNFLYEADSTLNSITLTFIPGFYKAFVEFNEEEFNEFIDRIKNILEHEKVHQEQFKKIEISSKDGYSKVIKKQDTNKLSQYLSNKEEIMAWAKNNAHELLREYGKDKALEILKNPDKYYDELPDRFALIRYLGVFNIKDKPFQRFLKYSYEYIYDNEN